MTRVTYLTPSLAVTGALQPHDLAILAEEGFRTVINNRPDAEQAGQLSGREEALLARRAGLAYAHVPAAMHDVLEPGFLERLEAVLDRSPGPILMHCRSGMRSAIAWAVIAIKGGAAAVDVFARTEAAGLDLSHVTQEITEAAATLARSDLSREAAA